MQAKLKRDIFFCSFFLFKIIFLALLKIGIFMRAFSFVVFSFNLEDLKDDKLESLILALSDFKIDIDSKNERVRIYCGP